jgi:RNA polymerase sigma factor (sigma-70 family)
LLEQLAVDPEGGLREVVDTHGARLIARLRRYATVHHEYGDLDVHDVFSEALLQLIDPAYRAGLRAAGGDILAYLSKWGKWRLNEAARERMRQSGLAEELGAQLQPSVPRSPVLSPVLRALARLSPRDHDVLHWRHVECCSNTEVGNRLHISEGAAKKAAHDARARFKKLLLEEGFETR